MQNKKAFAKILYQNNTKPEEIAKLCSTTLRQIRSWIKGWEIQAYKTDVKNLKYHTGSYKQWRTAVLERDNYTCQICKKKPKICQVDHIKSWANHPELRFDLSNGRVLCVPCHSKQKTTRIYKKFNKN